MLRYLVVCALTVSAFGQTPKAGSADSAKNPEFQVATIKPSGPTETRTTQIQGNRFATTDTSVADLLKYAYGLQEQEIVGGPKWLQTQKLDIVGEPETETRPSSDEFKKMVQDLLADRFHLTTHREMREMPVFAIVPAKSGPKLIKSIRPPDGIPAVGYSPGRLSVGNATIADLATFLQRFVIDRPVVDETGVTGKYDFVLRWTPDESQAEEAYQANKNNSSLPGLYTAIQEQFGLKLKAEKLPIQVFVIDHADMPSED